MADDNAVWIRRLTDEEAARIVEHEYGAESGDARRAAAFPADGPLAGIRFAVKDNIDIAGLPTTAGFRDREAATAARTATSVSRLMRAGAVPVGKTNLDQFATGLVGTRSPYGACHAHGHPGHVSGGSSSGSAVAVASGQVELALGTDTAGSGRVPAAFNGIVGVKPTRGLVSTSGVLPACRSLDCVSVFARDVRRARAALAALTAPDPADPYSRTPPPHLPLIAAVPNVLAVPAGTLDLDPPHREAWQAAIEHARKTVETVVEVDIEPFLEAARLLYQGPWLADRWRAIAPHLGEFGLDHPGLDPAVRRVLGGADAIGAGEVFAGFEALEQLRRRTERLWLTADALLVPTTPGHPTLDQVAADPVGVNTRLGTYTNFVNLLDLCAVAVPAGRRADGLPFGVQLIAPAFADGPLLELAARWTGETGAGAAATGEAPDLWQGAPHAGLRPGRTRLAVAGAHLSGLPLNHQMLELGGRLHRRTRTAPGYRLLRLPGPTPVRPGLYPGEMAGPGIDIEIWDLPQQAVGILLDTIPRPLGLAPLQLADGETVPGFLAHGPVPADALDVTAFGGWRAYLDHAHAAPRRPDARTSLVHGQHLPEL